MKILQHKTTRILAQATRHDNAGRRSFLVRMTRNDDGKMFQEEDIGWVSDAEGTAEWQEYVEPKPYEDPPPEPPRMTWRERNGIGPAGMYLEEE